VADFRIQEAASRRLDDIYAYSCETWGETQGQAYIRRLFACFEDIAARRVAWRSIPAEFGVNGFYVRCEHHYVYWRILSDGGVGIVTILHERMHQIARFRDDAPG
jgi:toxin ParE1/3/4